MTVTMEEEFYRIKRLPPYVFAEVNALKAQARAAGRDVIDLGMGNPDGPTPAAYRRQADRGGAEPARPTAIRRRAASPGCAAPMPAYYARRFGVELDPEREVIVTLGSKEGLANLAQAITAPGDIVLVPNPCYPIHAFGFIMAGASVRHVPIGPEVDFLRRAEEGGAALACRRRWRSCSTSRPTRRRRPSISISTARSSISAATTTSVVLSDLAYAEIYFDGKPPPSILQVPGARDIAVEFSSLSKTYSMAGWRIGFAVGNRAADRGAGAGQILSRLRRLHADPGRGDGGAQRPAGLHRRNPRALQGAARRAGRRAAPSGLGHPGAAGDDVRLGADAAARSATMGSLAFSKLLLEAAPMSRSSPGVGFGEYGEGFVRIALVENRQRLRQAAATSSRS